MKIFPSLNDIVYLGLVFCRCKKWNRMSSEIESKLLLVMPLPLLLHNANTMSCYCLLPFCNNAHFILFSKYHCVLICYFRMLFILFLFSLCACECECEWVCVLFLSLLKYIILGLGFVQNGNSCILHSIFTRSHANQQQQKKKTSNQTNKTKQNKTRKNASRVKTANWISELYRIPSADFESFAMPYGMYTISANNVMPNLDRFREDIWKQFDACVYVSARAKDPLMILWYIRRNELNKFSHQRATCQFQLTDFVHFKMCETRVQRKIQGTGREMATK